MSMMHKVRVENRVVNTTVVNTIPQLDQSLRNLLLTINKKAVGSKHVVGLDIEKYYRGIGDHLVAERVAIVKLCFGTSCLIIQLLHMKEPPCPLAEFLQLPELSFVGVGIKHTLEALNRDYRISCSNAVDLGQLAADVKEMPSYRSFGLLDLTSTVCSSLNLNGSAFCNRSAETLRNWGAATLSEKQVEAATWGAFLCFCVGNQLFGGFLPGSSGSGCFADNDYYYYYD